MLRARWSSLSLLEGEAESPGGECAAMSAASLHHLLTFSASDPQVPNDRTLLLKATFMNHSTLSKLLLMLCLGCLPITAFSQQKIPTGGVIPDVRGFNNKISDQAETSGVPQLSVMTVSEKTEQVRTNNRSLDPPSGKLAMKSLYFCPNYIPVSPVKRRADKARIVNVDSSQNEERNSHRHRCRL